MPVNDISATEAPSVLAPAGSGPLDTTQATSGLTQNGCFGIPNTNAGYSGMDRALVQKLPALTRVILPPTTNPTVAQLGPQEYQTTLSLSGTDTVQLSPAYANSQNVPTAQVAPAVPAFTYTSRNSYVATVSPTGMVTGLHIGECTVLVSAFRGINATFAGTTPPAGLTGCEIALELSVKVRD
jgi:Bacterial Ig-like domain (group 2)